MILTRKGMSSTNLYAIKVKREEVSDGGNLIVDTLLHVHLYPFHLTDPLISSKETSYAPFNKKHLIN